MAHLYDKRVILFDATFEEATLEIKRHILLQSISHLDKNESSKLLQTNLYKIIASTATAATRLSGIGQHVDLDNEPGIDSSFLIDPEGYMEAQEAVKKSKQIWLADVFDSLTGKTLVPATMFSKFLGFYKMFLEKQAPLEVNIPSSVQKQIKSVLECLPIYKGSSASSPTVAAAIVDSNSHVEGGSASGNNHKLQGIKTQETSNQDDTLQIPRTTISELRRTSASGSFSGFVPKMRERGSSSGKIDVFQQCAMNFNIFQSAKDDVVRSLFLNTFPHFAKKKNKKLNKLGVIKK